MAQTPRICSANPTFGAQTYGDTQKGFGHCMVWLLNTVSLYYLGAISYMIKMGECQANVLNGAPTNLGRPLLEPNP